MDDGAVDSARIVALAPDKSYVLFFKPNRFKLTHKSH